MYHLEPTPVLGDWFYLRFIENEGMAFGWKAGGEWGKLLLSVFRIGMVVLIFRYVRKLIRNGAHKGLIASIALILAGAIGNIIDSMFYGIIFTESADYGPVATLAALGEGYAVDRPLGGFLFGSVVDMLYFPVIEGTWPEWVPRVGGENFLFFRPVFNIADAAISIGVALIIIRQRKFFADQGGLFSRKKKKEDAAEQEAEVVEDAAESTEGGSAVADVAGSAVAGPNAPPPDHAQGANPGNESEEKPSEIN